MSCVLPGTHPLSFCAQGTIDDHSGTGHPELGRSYTQHFLFRLEATGAVTFPGQPGASHTESRRYADPAPGCELILSKFSVALPGLTGMCPSTVLIRRGRLGSAAGRKSPQIPVLPLPAFLRSSLLFSLAHLLGVQVSALSHTSFLGSFEILL
jgi:hypothetical protein